MKKLYFLFFLTIGFFGNAQIINFPDANFKAKLLEADISNGVALDFNDNYFKIDANFCKSSSPLKSFPMIFPVGSNNKLAGIL